MKHLDGKSAVNLNNLGEILPIYTPACLYVGPVGVMLGRSTLPKTLEKGNS